MKESRQDRQCREMYDALLANLAEYVAHWARKKPGDVAIIEHDTGEVVSWKRFDTAVHAFAAKLLSVGIGKGDVVATSLPLLKEHIFLMYACYRIGAILAPLDLRLQAKEIRTCLASIRPKAYFFLGKTPVADFRPIVREVISDLPSIRHFVQFQKEADLVIAGAVGITDFVRDIKRVAVSALLTGKVKRARRGVGKRDPCLVIFTTGSTGSPKPAMLCHENILVQNIGLAVGFAMGTRDRMLVNLPPSHVGCSTEQLATTIFAGGTAVLLHVFDPIKSLQAIEKHKVTLLGQIPALFNLEWRLPEYARFDLSSLRLALYGGQTVSLPFLEKLKTMAPGIATGLGLTETAGFCTYTDPNASVEEIGAGIGFDSPLCPISIREPMNADRTAGAIKPLGEQGEICFSGPQVFLGYLGNPEATTRTVSTDGVCYTGDLGSYDVRGLHYAGRTGLVIKPKGYQVFPEDVESHIALKLKGRVTAVACVGAEHAVFCEAIVAFVEPVVGSALDPEEVLRSCDDIASYSRPSHVELLTPGGFPLNRVAKTDYLALRERARDVVARLRAEGRWDR